MQTQTKDDQPSPRRVRRKRMGTDLSTRQLFTLEDLWEQGVPFSRSHLTRLAQQGKFPAPVKLGGSRVAWVAQEIRDWLTDRAAERHAA